LKKIKVFFFILAVTSTVWSFDLNNCYLDDVQHFEYVGQERWIELYDMLDKDYDIGVPYRSLHGTLYAMPSLELFRQGAENE
jgi:hypothetical protein